MEETEALVRLAMRGPVVGGGAYGGLLRPDDPMAGYAAELDGILGDSELLSSFISDDFAVPGGLGALGLPPGEEPEYSSSEFPASR